MRGLDHRTYFRNQRNKISREQTACERLGCCRRAATALRHRKGLHFQRGATRETRLGQRKLAWLQRHDQDCGSLYGVLLLCVGLPVTATDHLDRRRGILRGCPGEVVGWAWPKEASDLKSQEKTKIWNELPGCIMVRFHTKDTWRVEGILEDNVYPVPAQKKPWYLDKGRRRPVLRVTRKQFPLAPAFATTAHAAQGQTCPEGVVADLQIGEAGDPLTVYIAITRVRDRQGLFIYRPFDAAPFQRGAKLGRDLLLRFWRGDTMDWAALRAKYREERQCAECKEQKPASGYTLGRWKRMDAARICKECLQRHGAMMQPWQCMACYMWKQEDAFVAKYRRDEAECARWIPSMLGLHEPGPWARNAPARHDAKGERMFCSAGPRDPVQKPGKPTAKASTGHGGKSRGPPGRHACQSRAAQA